MNESTFDFVPMNRNPTTEQETPQIETEASLKLTAP